MKDILIQLDFLPRHYILLLNLILHTMNKSAIIFKSFIVTMFSLFILSCTEVDDGLLIKNTPDDVLSKANNSMCKSFAFHGFFCV
jgi:hypothetical protein